MNLARPFTPTTNRRLNELIGFLIFVFAILLVLALISYSPLDPSLNTAANPVAGRPAHNWIGVCRRVRRRPRSSVVRRLVLPAAGVSGDVFAALVPLARHRFAVGEVLGGSALVAFIAGLIGLLPWQVKWQGVPFRPKGLIGRIVADVLIHYLNVVGAYLVCLALIAVALYLSTAFSFGAIRIWSQARFGLLYAAMDRFTDWRAERARKKAARDLEKKRAQLNAKPVVTAQLVPKRAPAPAEAAVRTAKGCRLPAAQPPAPRSSTDDSRGPQRHRPHVRSRG